MDDTYSIDLHVVWPRLWLVLPDHARAEIANTREGQTSAARLYGWAVLYLLPAAIWWPAFVAVVVLITTAKVRIRGSAANLSALVEAAVDLHGLDLARQLGVPAEGPFTRETGAAITAALRGTS